MKKEVINVGLYGGKSIFGGREKPLEASVISCDRHNACTYFKDEGCLNVRSLNGSCKFGSVSNIKGYTSRAQKYYKFKNEWTKHEKYGKLSYPSRKLGLIGDIVVFPYPYIQLKEYEGGRILVENPGFFSSIAFIEFEKFNTELIYRICAFRPQAMMGGEIESYQKEVVPLFLAHLKEILPERYGEFVSEYPQFEKEIDYIGRKAILKTIKPSHIRYVSEGFPKFNSKWYWDGEYLIFKDGYISYVNIVKDYEVAEFKIKPSAKSVVEISSNDQVTENTIFVD